MSCACVVGVGVRAPTRVIILPPSCTLSLVYSYGSSIDMHACNDVLKIAKRVSGILARGSTRGGAANPADVRGKRKVLCLDCLLGALELRSGGHREAPPRRRSPAPAARPKVSSPPSSRNDVMIKMTHDREIRPFELSVPRKLCMLLPEVL